MNLPANWKTTANGLLAAFIGTVGPVTAYLATTNNPRATTVCGILTCAAAIARVWVGLLQSDALTPNQTGQIAITSVQSGVASTVAPVDAASTK